MELEQFFAQHPKAALGLSGGVDSAYLLWAGLRYGAQLQPYFVKTAFQPAFELRDAQQLCQSLGVELTVLPLDVLALPTVAQNPADRCYYCKKALFGALGRQAAADGFSVLLDGTNASDDAGDRPGMRALAELRVLSPLRLCGLTKAQVRQGARQAGLAVWDKPAYACLATRVPQGRALTASLLDRVEQAEGALAALGFSDFRVRVLENAARIQLPASQWAELLHQAEQVKAALAPYFDPVLLDLCARETEG